MLELGYIALSFAVIFIIILTYHYGLKKLGLNKTIITKRIASVAIGFLLWFIYVFMVAKTGFLENFSLPPRFPILLIFPLFIFTGIVLYKNRNGTIFKVIPPSWSVYFQSFRVLVESLFVATVAEDLLHPEVTIEGYNYDMIFAITAPIIAYLSFKLKKLSKKVVIVWNYVGLAVLVSVILLFTTTTYAPALWGSETPLSPIEMVHFPYILVAAFLMPTAVFVHIFSLIQLRKHP